MNTDIFEGKWKQLKGQVKVRWGKLTDDDLDVAEGHSQYLAGKLQERYGLTKEKAEEYILINKPCLSINDIMDITDENNKLALKEFKKLVKSKN